MADYSRPMLTPEQQQQLLTGVARFMVSPRQTQVKIISALLIENALLSLEVNTHRQALGYDPLPLYDPIPNSRRS